MLAVVWRLTERVGVAVVVALVVLAVPAVAGAQDFGDRPGCGSSGCPGGSFISQLIGWVGQYSLWACFAAAVGGFGFWAWSKSQGGGYGMASGQRYILAGFAGIAGIALATAIASTLWDAASVGG
jgi:hypothetical protein